MVPNRLVQHVAHATTSLAWELLITFGVSVCVLKIHAVHTMPHNELVGCWNWLVDEIDWLVSARLELLGVWRKGEWVAGW